MIVIWFPHHFTRWLEYRLIISDGFRLLHGLLNDRDTGTEINYRLCISRKNH